MTLRSSPFFLAKRRLTKFFGVVLAFFTLSAPAYCAVDLIGDISTGAVSDPWIMTVFTSIGAHQPTILDIYDGGVVDNPDNFLFLGGETNDHFTRVNVRDTGSSLSARDLIVGNSANGAMAWLFVENGGAVSVDNDLEFGPPSLTGPDTIVVTGSGSQLRVGDYFRMSSNSEIVVANEASVETGFNLTSSPSNLVVTSISDATIRGSGSTWTDHNYLRVSNLRVQDGGHLISTNDVSINPFEISGKASLDGGTITAEKISRSDGGRLDFHSGTLILNQAGLTVGSSGLLGSDVYVDPSSTIDVSGEIVVASTAMLFVEGSLVSSSLTNNGRLILEGATLDQPVTSPSGSTIDVIGDVTFNGLVSGAGGIFGSGTTTFNGGYSPGDSPAVVPIETDLALGALNSFNIELAGTASGEFDQLSIVGDVSLAGVLDVSLIDGFAIDPLQDFTILEIQGQRSGQFEGLAEGALVGSHEGVDMFITYAAGDGNDVALFTTAIPEPTSMALLTSAIVAILFRRKRHSLRRLQPCLGAITLVLISVSPTWASIVTVGSVSPYFDPVLNHSQRTSPWNPSSLKVGFVGSGLLQINTTEHNGFNYDTVNVDGTTLVGSSASGTLVLTGDDVQLTTDVFKVGNGAPGFFLVSDGASGVSGHAEGESRIGGDPVVGTGQAVITGSGSSWTHYDLITNGLGELSVTNGGQVNTTNFARIAGPVMITGTDSVWDVGGLSLSTGVGSVIVADGGQVNVMGEFFLPSFPSGEPALFENQGVRMNSGSSLTIRGGTFSTNYFVTFAPGGVDFEYGTFNLSDSGLVVGAAGLLGDAVDIDAGSAINLSDDITVDAGATLTVAGTLSSANLNNNGVLTLIDTTLDQAVVSPAGSTINVIGIVTFNGLVSGAADVFGSGTPIFNGGYSPGDSPAIVEIENDLIFGPTNTLAIELGGALPGEFDQLNVMGNATLDGMLDVSLLSPFIPAAASQFLIMNIEGERSGEFIGLAEGALFGSLGGQDLFITYQAGNGNDVALFSVPEPASMMLLILGGVALIMSHRAV